MIDPQGFDVVDAINPHMQGADGRLNRIDQTRARNQWQALKQAYESIGLTVDVLDSDPSCPDMVFCANQTLPFLLDNGSPAVVLSNMANEGRQREVAPIRKQLEARGISCFELPARTEDTLFEGMGDALWVPGRRLICGGYGYRTRKDIYTQVEAITQSHVVLFELVHPRFYHLDTCLSLLDEQTVLACQEGFHPRDWNKLQSLFTKVIPVPLHEADAPGFACNAHCPDGKHVLLQKGNEETCRQLRDAGFVPIELETDEFIKSGGSVFCMKLQTLWN